MKRSRPVRQWMVVIILLLLLFFIGNEYLSLIDRETWISPLTTHLKEPEPLPPEPVVTVQKIVKPVRIPVRKDSVIVVVDTTPSPDTVAMPVRCGSDTTAPWVYPDPSGGLHYKKIAVQFVVSEPCTVMVRKGRGEWQVSRGALELFENCTLTFKAWDTCGNEMAQRTEVYRFGVSVAFMKCGPGMEYVKAAGVEVCIDQYEWPNRKGMRPAAHVSVYHAMDSCFTAGKRLCTTPEWSAACAGVDRWAYTYGSHYEPLACVTRDTAAHVAGSKPECRGYFEIYDMCGNLAEWTGTRSKKNNSYFEVMGGFWDSGPQGTCGDARYSYYPENKHNPVGFRCCKDANNE